MVKFVKNKHFMQTVLVANSKITCSIHMKYSQCMIEILVASDHDFALITNFHP